MTPKELALLIMDTEEENWKNINAADFCHEPIPPNIIEDANSIINFALKEMRATIENIEQFYFDIDTNGNYTGERK